MAVTTEDSFSVRVNGRLTGELGLLGFANDQY
jgi:hypothetical protein